MFPQRDIESQGEHKKPKVKKKCWYELNAEIAKRRERDRYKKNKKLIRQRQKKYYTGYYARNAEVISQKKKENYRKKKKKEIDLALEKENRKKAINEYLQVAKRLHINIDSISVTELFEGCDSEAIMFMISNLERN